MKSELPITLPVEKVIDEAEGVKSLIFRHKLDAKPGQFLMVWIPRVDLKPFGVSYLEEGSFGITVCKVGPTSEKLCRAKKGDLLGIMGPYGKPFTLEGRRIILVAGGYGAAPLFPLAEEAKKKGITTTFIIGAKSESYLIYRERAKKAGINTIITTDDGSCGRKCFTTDALEDALKAGGIDKVYSCGPEIMLKKVAELCRRHQVKCEVSMHRYMKCGFGVCGSCSVDDQGFPLCKKVVLTGEEALRIKEFGQHSRDASGTKQPFAR
ncbi:dihydroorotate dehydrogenase electron transfer subunit [Candidatus Woesearchaeota archaeon]|nr:dihydroorotate dehydrogenase electron transfer subunit [Candidatus Woesearchaeota archaeon]